MNSTGIDLLMSIDNISIIEESATINTIQSINNCYNKALMILESYEGDDLSAFDVFQEGVLKDSMGQKYENVLFRIAAFIPRLLINTVKAIGKIFSKKKIDDAKEVNVPENLDSVDDKTIQSIVTYVGKNGKGLVEFDTKGKTFTVKEESMNWILRLIKAGSILVLLGHISKIITGDDKAYNEFKREMEKIKEDEQKTGTKDKEKMKEVQLKFLKEEILKNAPFIATSLLSGLNDAASKIQDSIDQDLRNNKGDSAARKTILNNVLADVQWLINKIMSVVVIGGVVLGVVTLLRLPGKLVKTAVNNYSDMKEEKFEELKEENDKYDFTKITTEPSDWKDTWDNYYTIMDNGLYKHLDEVHKKRKAPKFDKYPVYSATLKSTTPALPPTAPTP